MGPSEATPKDARTPRADAIARAESTDAAALFARPPLAGRYTKVRQLGSGGTSEVYLVEDAVEPPPRKAIKILRSNLPAELVSSFRDEFRALVSLEHPGLARVYEFGAVGARAFYTAEFVEGQTLHACTGISLRDLCLVMAAVCRTLAYLHTRGYVHNDVKPSNIVVPARREQSRLLDFGLAGLDRAGSRSGAGTPGYIAPERLAGSGWDGRADLYAVGATLYRIVGGQRLTRASAPPAALSELRAGWPSLASLRNDLPKGLSELVEQLLSLDPDRRPQHAFEIVLRLGEIVGEPLPLQTPGSTHCYALSSVLIGREAELLDLEGVLGEPDPSRRVPLLAVAGDAGSGKSRLIRELHWRAQTTTWKGRIAGVGCREDATALDPLLRLGAQLGVELDAAQADDLETTLEALGRAVFADELPTVLVVGDADRAADSVWQAIFALAHRAKATRAPVSWLVTFEPETLSTAARQGLALALAAGEAYRIELKPLTRIGIGRMLASLFGEGVIPAELEDSIAHRSRGNPLLVEEIVRELVESGVIQSSPSGWRVLEAATAEEPTPPTGRRSSTERLETFLRRRVRGLQAEAERTLRALVALGGRASLEALAAVVGRGVDVRYGASLLADRGLTAFRTGELVLEHEALHSIVREAEAPEQRTELYRRAASWLSSHGADAAELARVYRDAGDAQRAFQYARTAGLRAFKLGEGRRAAALLESAVAQADAGGTDPATFAETLRACGEAHSRAGRHDDALALFERAFPMLPMTERLERVRLTSLAVQTACRLGRAEQAAIWVERARGAVDPGDPLALARVARAEAMVEETAGQHRAARETLRKCIVELEAAAIVPGSALLLGQTLGQLAQHELHFDLAESLSLATRAVAAIANTNDRFFSQLLQNAVASRELYLGRLDSAIARLTETLDEAERSGNFYIVPFLLHNLALARFAHGEPAPARAALERIRALVDDQDQASGATVRTVADAAESIVAWYADDAATAEEKGSAVLSTLSGSRGPQFLEAGVAAVAGAAARGRVEAAERLAKRLALLASKAEAPLDQAFAALARGYIAAAADPTRGAPMLDAGVKAYAALGHRISLVPLLRDLSRFYALGGRSTEASACVAEAHEIARAWDASPWLAQLETKASERGQRKPTSTYEPVIWQATTLDELAGRVGELARASGLENGARLFVTTGARIRELGQSGAPAGTDLLEAVRRTAAGKIGEVVRGLVLHAFRTGSSSFVLALPHAGAALAPLFIETLAAAASALEARDSGTQLLRLPAAATAIGLADGVELSELELTLGPVELKSQFPQIVGQSPAVTRALSLLDRLSKNDLPVLLTGPTGTGKEVFARALHGASARASRPFVAVNCSAVPATLFEAELFGYRRGAFTGAVRDHSGFVKSADGGTLFLDEIGDLPLELQPKLLRVLQEERIQPVGAEREQVVDVRIVAATHRDLEREVAERRFRDDLFYRLNVVEIRLPPLQERASDIPELVRHFLERSGRSDTRITPRALKKLTSYAWPGNVRELENELQRALVLAGEKPIDERHLSKKIRAAARGEAASGASSGTLAEQMRAFERQVFRDALNKTGGNRTHAARLLGVSRQYFAEKLRRLGLQEKKR